MAPEKDFRVICVGGSVSGLTMAHTLERAGIDYLVLERGSEIAFAGGASIGLQPHGLRIMDQLGMYQDIYNTTVPIDMAMHRRPNGKAFSYSQFATEIEKRHGYPILFFEREELLHILYKALPDKSKVLCSKKVVDIQSSPECAVVTTADGSSYTADVVIGADGVNSFTRQAMWKLMSTTEPEIAKKESTAMFSEYACAFGVSEFDSPDPNLRPGVSHITYNEGQSSICIVSSRRKKFWFLILKHDKKYFAPNIPRFTHEEAEKTILQNLDVHITEEVTIRDLWKHKTKFTMVSLEEAMFERWHQGRLVLLGDAVHKVTPNAGHGGNTAIESAVTLANLLYDAKTGANAHSNLSYEGLLAIFEEYQTSRQERVALACSMSSMATRLQAMDTWLWKTLGLHIIPLFGEEMEANAASELIMGGEPLKFIDYKGKSGTMPWEGWDLTAYTPKSLLGVSMSTLPYLLPLAAVYIQQYHPLLRTPSVDVSARTSDSQSLALNTTTYESLLTSVVDQPSLVIDSWPALAVCMELLPIGIIFAVETLRIGNSKLLTGFPLIATLSLWFGGLPSLGALYLATFAVHDRLVGTSNPYTIILPLSRARSLFGGLILTVILSVIVTSPLRQFIWPTAMENYQQFLAMCIQLLPILPLFLTVLLSSLGSGNLAVSNLVRGHKDLNYLKQVFGAAGVLAALSHIANTVYNFTINTNTTTTVGKSGPYAWQLVQNFLLGAAKLDASLANSFSIFMAVALACVYMACAKAIPVRSTSMAAKVKLLLHMSLSTVVVGPGSTAAFFWLWREDKVRYSTGMEAHS